MEARRRHRFIVFSVVINLASLLASVKTYPPSVTLIEQSCIVESVYLVEDGIVKLQRWESAANRDLVVALRYPGSLLGATSVILGCPSPVTAQTITRCRVREARSDQFLREIKRNNTLSLQLHQIHSRYLQEQFSQIAELKALSARTRLQRLLWDLCQLHAPQAMTRDMRIRPPLKHVELAEALMITPQHLSRLLATMESENLLRRERGWLVIRDPIILYGGAYSPPHPARPETTPRNHRSTPSTPSPPPVRLHKKKNADENS